MPLPQPKSGEKYKQFVKRFLSNKEVKKKFPNIKQRFRVMADTWRKLSVERGFIPPGMAKLHEESILHRQHYPFGDD